MGSFSLEHEQIYRDLSFTIAMALSHRPTISPAPGLSVANVGLEEAEH